MKLSAPNIRLIFSNLQIVRRFSTNNSASVRFKMYANHLLYRRIASGWFAGIKTSNVLDRYWVKHQRIMDKPALVHCIKRHLTCKRYQLCFEILEWMQTGKFKFEYTECSLYLGIIHKVKGIDEAEKYFDSLPPDAKKGYMHGVLLNCYCSDMMVDKALALFKKMDELKYACNETPFANLMCLYIKVGQPEKVPPLVEEMKRRKINLKQVSYSTWIHSYACLNDLEGIEQIFDEVQKQKSKSVKNDWRLYNSFAAAYIKVGQNEKVRTTLNMMEIILDKSTNSERTAYHSLISMYGSVGDLESLTRAWGKMKLKYGGCHNTSYLTLFKALSKLGELELLTQYLKEWNSWYKMYDVRLPTTVIDAYLKHDKPQEAELVLKDAKDRTPREIWSPHVSLMDYYVRKRQIDSALRHLEQAIANQWKPKKLRKIDEWFEYFIEAKDVDGAERFCQILEKVQTVPAAAYSKLHKTYEAAGKKAPERKQRMVHNGANIGTEHKELPEKVCRNELSDVE